MEIKKVSTREETNKDKNSEEKSKDLGYIPLILILILLTNLLVFYEFAFDSSIIPIIVFIISVLIIIFYLPNKNIELLNQCLDKIFQSILELKFNKENFKELFSIVANSFVLLYNDIKKRIKNSHRKNLERYISYGPDDEKNQLLMNEGNEDNDIQAPLLFI